MPSLIIYYAGIYKCDPILPFGAPSDLPEVANHPLEKEGAEKSQRAIDARNSLNIYAIL